MNAIGPIIGMFIPHPHYSIGDVVWVKHGVHDMTYEATIISIAYDRSMPYRVRWHWNKGQVDVWDDTDISANHIYYEPK
eukprot:15365177-Ditylum_brightwellii.AAC.1